MAEHVLEKGKVHHKWDNSLPPVIEIASGDVVHCETAEVTNNQVTPGCDASVLLNLDFGQLYPLAGPIFVKDAIPGDILEVEILRLQPLDWGWTGIIPGLGLLAQDFTVPYIRHFDLSNGQTAPLRDDIHIPLQPFCATSLAPSMCCQPAKGAAILTPAILMLVPNSTCRSSCRAPFSRQAIAMQRRAMVKCASPVSSARCNSRCASM